jgi:hypothetical protein
MKYWQCDHNSRIIRVEKGSPLDPFLKLFINCPTLLNINTGLPYKTQDSIRLYALCGENLNQVGQFEGKPEPGPYKGMQNRKNVLKLYYELFIDGNKV